MVVAHCARYLRAKVCQAIGWRVSLGPTRRKSNAGTGTGTETRLPLQPWGGASWNSSNTASAATAASSNVKVFPISFALATFRPEHCGLSKEEKKPCHAVLVVDEGTDLWPSCSSSTKEQTPFSLPSHPPGLRRCGRWSGPLPALWARSAPESGMCERAPAAFRAAEARIHCPPSDSRRHSGP